MKRLLSLSLFLMTAMLSFAHDFEVKNADGKTIYYNITSSTDLTVEVTYKGTSSSEYYNEYTGDVTIPATVIYSYSGKTYSVTSIGSYAFYDCSGLKSITIPNSVTTIGNYAFRNCSALTSVTIPNSVTSIGSSAFRGCSGLTSITIPNSVTSIGDDAFYFCSGLTSITIPNSVTSIGDYAFLSCSGLTSIVVEKGNTKYDSRNNCNAIIETASNTLIRGCKTTVIPNGVTSIGDYAFSSCSGLTSVTIPNSVTSIGGSAFSGCSGLTSVTIGNSVTSIGGSAFSGCSGLTSVTIGNSVTSIGSSAFSYCSGLTSIVVAKGNTKYDSRDNCNAIIETASNTLIRGCKTTVIPNSVKTIGWGAFSGCNGLTSVTIPNSVTSIGSNAFSGCSGLTSVTINSNSIISKTYSYESNLSNIFGSQVKSYIIGDGVTSIGSYAFYNCSDLTSVTIPNSVTSIGDYAFRLCSGLTSVTINSNSIISNTSSESNLKNIFGSQVKSYIIGDGVTSIGSYAFWNCYSLTSITIPNSVTSIGNSAFYACSSLKEITSYIQKPFKTGDYCWDFVNKSIPLYVPAGTKEKYQSTDGWKYFTNIIEEPADPTGINSVDNSQSATGNKAGDWYTIDGRKLSGKPAQRGIYIVNGRKVAVK